jgi:GNAT superfamily N-acetyltransferase
VKPLIRKAVESDIVDVVRIHCAAFPGFFLTILGPNFLNLMYKGFLADQASVFLVAEVDSEVRGFAAGAARQRTQVRRMALRQIFQLLAAIFPAAIKSPVVITRRLASKLFSKDGHPIVPDNSMILRSIAVDPGQLGGGLAMDLIQEFESLCRFHNYQSVYLTTDTVNNDRVNRYYEKCGYVLASKFVQDSTRKMNLYRKDL